MRPIAMPNGSGKRSFSSAPRRAVPRRSRSRSSEDGMTWQVWSAFFVIETVLCITPGPAVLFVLSQALTRGVGKTVWSIGGILASNTAYFILSATGVGAILLASYDLFL